MEKSIISRESSLSALMFKKDYKKLALNISKRDLSSSDLETKSALLNQKSGLKLTDIINWT